MSSSPQPGRTGFSHRTLFRVFSLDVLAKLVLSVSNIAVIRFMPQIEFAYFSYANSLRGLITGTASGSFNRLFIVGYKSLDIERSPLSNGLLQLVVLSGLSTVVLSLADLPLLVKLVTGSFVLAATAYEFLRTYAQRDLRFHAFANFELARALISIVLLGAVLVVVGHALTALQVPAAPALAPLAVALLMVGRIVHREHYGRPLDMVGQVTRIWRSPYRFLFLYDVMLAVCSQVDVLSLKRMGSDSALATYGAALRYYGILLLALTAVHAVLLPTIQQARTQREIRAIFRSNRRLLSIAIPVILIGAWLAEWIIPTIDGGKYPDAVGVFRVLALSSIISLSFSPHANVVMRFERFRQLVLLALIAIAMNVTLNVLLTPRFGPLGTAWSYLASYCSLNLGIFILARRLLHEVPGLSDDEETAASESNIMR